MTAAKQAVHAVSAHTQVKMEDPQRLLKNSKIRLSRCLGASTMAEIMVKHRRSSGSS